MIRVKGDLSKEEITDFVNLLNRKYRDIRREASHESEEFANGAEDGLQYCKERIDSKLTKNMTGKDIWDLIEMFKTRAFRAYQDTGGMKRKDWNVGYSFAVDKTKVILKEFMEELERRRNR